MCDADAGILTYVWVKGYPAPFPDFSVYVSLVSFGGCHKTSQAVQHELIHFVLCRQHKCRNFNALKNWAVEHQMYTSETHGIERLPGTQELDVPP